METLSNAFSQFRSEKIRCESYDCKTTSVVKIQDSWSKFMLNVKIQNKNKNIQNPDCDEGYNGVTCKDAAGLRSSDRYCIKLSPNVGLMVQGDTEEVVRDEGAASTSQQALTGFEDESEGVVVLKEVADVWYKPTNTANSDLKDFLSRPVRIIGINWTIGSTLNVSYLPWTLFFNNANIKYKLHNYSFLRCDLKLKIMINASPFYYGALLLSYHPMGDATNSAPADALGNNIIPYSQRPHTWVYPQANEGAEMVLPYLNLTEWIQIAGTQGTGELNRMGRLHIDSLGTLMNANSVAGENISIEIYAWAENVELSGPTVSLAVQGDEYGSKGPISKVASAIARGSGLLSSVPVVGKYMTATSMASQAVADIASSFGYTKVPVLDNIKAFKNLPFHGLATSDQSDVTEKLSLDSKNELTIDNSCIGDIDKNSTMVSTFCMHSSYLTNFTWTSAQATNTLLWNTYVSPYNFSRISGTGQYIIDSTPGFVASQMFDYWRGDIVFDFKIVCSQYHRGRLRFSWDPIGDISGTADSTQTVYNEIVDISDKTLVSLRVPYIQKTSYLKVPSSLSTTYYGTSALAADTSSTINGILTCRVLNDQTSPVASADITVIVSVRCAENIEFASPKNIDNSLNFYTVQGDNGETTMGAASNVDPNVNLVYMGESVVSFRELMQRANHTVSWSDIIPTSQGEYHSTYFSRRPLYRGFDPNGIHSATGHVSSIAEPFNYVTTSPYHLITSCFLGERGSITWKLDGETIQDRSMEMSRSFTLRTAARYNPSDGSNISNINVSTSNNARMRSNQSSSNRGMSLVNQKTNTGLSANVPMYSLYTMLETSPNYRTLGNVYTATSQDTVKASWVTFEANDPTQVHYEFNNFYFQCGPDHSLVFFLNVPTLFEYADPVTT